jgi:hypothetical protein
MTALTPPPADRIFALRDGFYALVEGRVFGPWANAGAAQAGLETEQRRAAARRADTTPKTPAK